MKRLFTFLLAFVMALGAATAVFADPGDNVITENGGFETTFYRGQPRMWDFTPTQTGEYLLYLPTSGTLVGEIVGQTPKTTSDVLPGYVCYDLEGGTSYQLKIELNPATSVDRISDVFNIIRKMPLQSLRLSDTSLTGKRDEYHGVYVELDPPYYSYDGIKWSSSDESVLAIESTEGNSCGFRLKKTGEAKLTASLGGLSAVCTVKIEKATGEWDSYEVWPAAQTQKQFSLPANTGTSLSYTPTESGTFALHTDGGVHVNVRGTSPSHILNNKRVDTMYGDYELVDLIADETYVIEIGPSYMDGNSHTGTAYIEKARAISKITLFGSNMTDVPSIVGYVGGMKDLFAVSDPIYAYALGGGFVYSSSNSSVAAPDYGEAAGNHINLYKEGSCNITVTSGGVSESRSVTVRPSPVLKAGFTTKLEFAPTDAYGVTCLFTPEKSGNYTFTIKGTGGTCHIEDTNIGNYIEGSGSMSGWLQAGKTYKVILFVGESDHTVSVSGGGSTAPSEPTTPDKPTEPEQPTDPDKPTEPEQPTDPENPDDPADPGDSTTPDQPATPDKPTEPDTPTDPNQPAAPADPGLEDLAEQMGGEADGKNIRVDVDTDEVSLFVGDLSQLSDRGGSLIVRGSGFEVKLDDKALAAIASSGKETVKLKAGVIQKDGLAEAQKDALTGKTATLIISVGLSLGEESIHDFAGGTASVTVSFTPEKNKEYTVYYLAEDGTFEKVASSFTDSALTFTTGHFSEYVIIEKNLSSIADNGGADGPAYVSEEINLLPWILIGALVLSGAAVVFIFMMKKKK